MGSGSSKTKRTNVSAGTSKTTGTKVEQTNTSKGATKSTADAKIEQTNTSKNTVNDKADVKMAEKDTSMSTADNKPSSDTKMKKVVQMKKYSRRISRGASSTQPGLSEDGWQDKDVSALFESLSVSDTKESWIDHMDLLMSRYDSKVVPEKMRTGWKTVRLFVSSTFKDMSNEREYLVKKIFPQLRIWCEERKLRLVECDLRWGVPKDADTRETLLACLSEIDRCREENVHAYFLNLTSERYGWAPKPEEIPDDIKAKYKWMPGMSATAMEIMIGGYWDRNTKALYMIRKPDFLSSVSDEKVLSYYKEKDENKKEMLRRLKDKLKEKLSSQVCEYSCKVEKVENGVVYLSGLEAMGDRVLTHFMKQMELQYPASNLGVEPSLAEVLKMEHETFMFQRSQVLLGRETSVKILTNYIDDENSDVPLVMIGYPGTGKSALMAYSVKMCLEKTNFKVFYHFIGATPRSTDLYQILVRFFMEHMPRGTKMPEDVAEMKRFSETMFNTAAEKCQAKGYKRFVVFMDALNQMDDDGDAQYLAWLPRILPKGMRLIVSTLEGKCLDSLRDFKKRPQEMLVEPLGPQVRQDIAESILAEYNKKLDQEQMKLLTEKSEAGRPLWLTIACEELRIFGDFRKLTNKVKEIPDNIIGLLEMVLTRIASEFGEDLVIATLCLIETSRFGLLENELLELLAMSPTIPGGKASTVDIIDGKVSMTKWALVYLGLRSFLRPCGSSGEGRLDFHHRTISKVVRKMYLTSEDVKIKWHRRLVEYFQTCTDIERKAEELPYHEEMAGEQDQLRETLLSRSMFEELYQERNKQQLMKYWQYLGGYGPAAEAYKEALKGYIKDGNLTDIDDIEPIQTKVAWFLVDIGEYDVARGLLEEVITKVVAKHGNMAKHLADALHAMVFLLYRKALKFVYGSHPGYKECRTLGERYVHVCAEIYKKHFSDQESKVGRVLTVCGYFQSSPYLNEAKDLFEKNGDKQGLAEVLYLLGEKNQYHQDLSVPTQLFTRSMLLCMSTYGRFHLHTARCCQLFGQMYWNNWIYQKRSDWLESCLDLYQQELEILTEILGPTHVTTVRSREDVIIILQNLGRQQEALKHQADQPEYHEAV